MMKCAVCKTEVQEQHRFCSNCGALLNIQQQAEASLPTVRTSPNQLGEQVQGSNPDATVSSELTLPEGKQSGAPQMPATIIGGSPQPGVPQVPGMGIGEFSQSGAPQQPGLGVGEFSQPGVHQQPISGVSGQLQHGTPQQPISGVSGQLQPGVHQQPISGVSGQLQHGTPQQPISGVSGQLQHGTPQQPVSGVSGQLQRGAHQQPEIQHGAHQQPEIQHGAHQQPAIQHGAHHQPQIQHGAHHQAGAGMYTQPPVHASQSSSVVQSVGDIAHPTAKAVGGTAHTAGRAVSGTARAIAGRVVNTIVTIAILATAGVSLYTVGANNGWWPRNPLPGNSAPSDGATFQVNLSVQGQYDGGNGAFSNTITLNASGGSVCSPADTGQIQQIPISINGQPATENAKLSCSGTYKGGHITYTETLISAVISGTNQGNPYTCTLLNSGPREQLSGSYADGKFSGTITVYAFPVADFSCPSGDSFNIVGGSGTWTGTVNS